MSDERLRELERAYRASGSAADRLRWLEARALATGDSHDRFKAAIAAYDSNVLQARVEEFLRAQRELRSAPTGETFPPLPTALAVANHVATLALFSHPQLGFTPSVDYFHALWFESGPRAMTIPALAQRFTSDVDWVVETHARLFLQWERCPLSRDRSHFAEDVRQHVTGLVLTRSQPLPLYGPQTDNAKSRISATLALFYEDAGLAPLSATLGKVERLVEEHASGFELTPMIDAACAFATRLRFGPSDREREQ
ncbi:hypothetical protein OAX78_00465 [Planctomycetota bacterium]|nr:hypothetical protein [Planctomycetota bacterium]